jgi:hypothetical protein
VCGRNVSAILFVCAVSVPWDVIKPKSLSVEYD